MVFRPWTNTTILTRQRLGMSEQPPIELSPDDAYIEASISEAELAQTAVNSIAARMIAS
jgi:hypothetical protein